MTRTSRPAKLERLETRADYTLTSRITAAASANNESISKFLLRTALKEADAILGPVDVTLMPADQYADLIAALDEDPEVNPAIVRLAQQARQFRRS